MWPFARGDSSKLKPRGESPDRKAPCPEKTPRLGRRGEKLARKRLKRAGLKILARNFRCPSGEIDLIALDRSTRREIGAETIVFVEVKTRSSDEYTDPDSAVDAEKRRRIRRAAKYYLAHYPADGLAWRFDIVSIVARSGGEPELRHIPDAFGPSER